LILGLSDIPSSSTSINHVYDSNVGIKVIGETGMTDMIMIIDFRHCGAETIGGSGPVGHAQKLLVSQMQHKSNGELNEWGSQ
jgi:hypothetical protein